MRRHAIRTQISYGRAYGHHRFYTPEDKSRFSADEAVRPLLLGARETECSLRLKTDDPRGTQSHIIDALSRQNVQPLRLETLEPALEDLFMEAVK